MVTTHDTHRTEPPRLAVVGGGPVGLALALLMRQRCPGWSVSVFDARPADRDVSADPRTLALSLGSVQLLERLRAWPGAEISGAVLGRALYNGAIEPDAALQAAA